MPRPQAVEGTANPAAKPRKESPLEVLRDVPRQHLLLATAVLIVVALAIANFVGEGEEGGVGPFIIGSAISIAIAALMLLRVVPSATATIGENRAARIGLVAGIFAVISLLAFWSGLPFALGVPAAVLGTHGRAQAQRGRGGEATAALVLGTAAVILGLVGAIFG